MRSYIQTETKTFLIKAIAASAAFPAAGAGLATMFFHLAGKI